MKTPLSIVLLLLSSTWVNATCTITIGAVTTSPAQNITRTFTDTDANCALALQALSAATTNQNAGTIPTPAQAFTMWANNVIRNLVNITSDYQKQQQSVTPINPQ